MSYASSAERLVLFGKLAPSDLDDVHLSLYTDADWAGDASHTRSTSGVWLELHCEKSGHSWPLAWSASMQTCTGVATADTESAAASLGLRREAIPAQTLFETILGWRPAIVHHIDNMQAISAIRRGYSKKLRHIGRTQKVNLGFLNDILEDPEMLYSVVHRPTKEMKADLLTKALPGPQFIEARELIQLYLKT